MKEVYKKTANIFYSDENLLEQVNRLVPHFNKILNDYKKAGYNKHYCNDVFINPFLEILN